MSITRWRVILLGVAISVTHVGCISILKLHLEAYAEYSLGSWLILYDAHLDVGPGCQVNDE